MWKELLWRVAKWAASLALQWLIKRLTVRTAPITQEQAKPITWV